MKGKDIFGRKADLNVGDDVEARRAGYSSRGSSSTRRSGSTRRGGYRSGGTGEPYTACKYMIGQFRYVNSNEGYIDDMHIDITGTYSDTALKQLNGKTVVGYGSFNKNTNEGDAEMLFVDAEQFKSEVDKWKYLYSKEVKR